MNFSTELAATVIVSENTSKYLEAGIHENVKLVEARANKSPMGNKFIEFTFEKDGKTIKHTEWEPTASPNATPEQTQSKATNQVARIMQILKCFYAKELLNFTGNSYEDFSKWVVTMLTAADKNKNLKVKVVYNNKGYTTLPSYAKFAFIEPMELPMGYYEEGKNDSLITELSIDVFTRPIVADKEIKVENPLDITQSIGINTNVVSNTTDLPF